MASIAALTRRLRPAVAQPLPRRLRASQRRAVRCRALEDDGQVDESGPSDGGIINPSGEAMPAWYTPEMREADEALIKESVDKTREERRQANAERDAFRARFGDLGIAAGGGEGDEHSDEDAAEAEAEVEDATATPHRRRLRRKIRQIETESALRDVRFPADQIYERAARDAAKDATSRPKTQAEVATEEARRVGLIETEAVETVGDDDEKYAHVFGMTEEQLDAYTDEELEVMTDAALSSMAASSLPLSDAEVAELDRLEEEAEAIAAAETARAAEAENALPGASIEPDAYEEARAEAAGVATELARIADDTKAEDIEVIDVSGTLYWCSHWIVLSVFSRPQMNAVAERLRKRGIELGRTLPNGRAETRQQNWMLLDFGDVVVHVLTPAARAYYDLEGRFPTSPRVPLDTVTKARDAARVLAD